MNPYSSSPVAALQSMRTNRGGNYSASSWNDLPMMDTLDPRNIIQSVSLQDDSGAPQPAKFVRSSTWLGSGPWVNPVLKLNGNPGIVTAPLSADYQSVEAAQSFIGMNLMTAPTPSLLPSMITRRIYMKAGSPFINTFTLEFIGAVTSSDILLSFRHNSFTSGDFQNAGTGTVPCFQFPAVTYSGVGRAMQVTLLATGVFDVALRVHDNDGNYSMFEMEWVVMS